MNMEAKDIIIQNLIKDIKCENNMGIPSNGYIYHILNENQDRDTEYEQTKLFLHNLITIEKEYFDNPNIKFINYGDTELVYVIDEKGYKRTLLVGQPCTKYGEIKIEYENLIKLHKENPNLIICPTAYFSNGIREAYLTPYINQARCIASSNDGYGAYVPEPYYHFQNYNEYDEYIITSTMVANIIKTYNEKEKLGLVSCKIGGGDFILEKEYDDEEHTIENTLKRIHLIAARKLINIELNDYLKILKNELLQKTYYNNFVEKDPNIIINLKNRMPMQEEAIENGISLGLKLRK